MYCVPQEFQVNGKVGVDYPVAHGAHDMPGDFRILFFHFVRNLAGHFANNDEIQFNGADGFIIGAKGFEIHAFCERLDFGDGVQDVLDSFLPVSR